MAECKRCKGTGKVGDFKCTMCNGTGDDPDDSEQVTWLAILPDASYEGSPKRTWSASQFHAKIPFPLSRAFISLHII
jgi:hypothetical protein